MKKRSNYTIQSVKDNTVFLLDLGGNFPSVTNDAENVFDEVSKIYPNHRIVYRDSMGSWDEIKMHNGQIRFTPVYSDHE